MASSSGLPPIQSVCKANEQIKRYKPGDTSTSQESLMKGSRYHVTYTKPEPTYITHILTTNPLKK